VDGKTSRQNGLSFEDALRRVRNCAGAAAAAALLAAAPFDDIDGAIRKAITGRTPHHYVTAEILGPRWLELTVRVDGRMIARSGWSLDHFSEDTLENISDWLELQAMAAERRHLQVMG